MSKALEEARPAEAPQILPLVALVLGAIAIGASPIMVRLTEVGPFASAFWRTALAIPALGLWAAFDRPRKGPAAPALDRNTLKFMGLAGVLFSGDLVFWHLSILHTTVANATTFANFSPVIVTIGAWWFLKERIVPAFLVGLAIAMGGVGVLMGTSFTINPAYLQGDLYGLTTAFFFASYILAVRMIRGRVSAARIMLGSTAVTAVCLGVVVLFLEPNFWPHSLADWSVLVLLAWISQAGGQGLLAYALGHLPAGFSSLIILLEPVAAALLGWLILSEGLTPMQGVGAAIILSGVVLARRASR